MSWGRGYEEAVNDRAKLILHRLIARRLAREPGLIEAARSRLSGSVSAPDHVREELSDTPLDF